MALCYHGVHAMSSRAHDPDFYRVAPSAFEAQVELLRSAGFELVTVAELAKRTTSASPAVGLAALSFDDGAADVHSTALPILRALGVPATAYITTGMIDRPNPFLPPEAESRMMNAGELRELHEAGWELGAHTVSHPDLAQLDEAACLAEMAQSKEALEQIIGARVRTFAYPFCSYGAAALAAAERVGFDAAVTCHGRGGGNPLEVPRSIVTGKDGIASFVLKLHGVYEPMFASAPQRLARAGTRGIRRRMRAAFESRG